MTSFLTVIIPTHNRTSLLLRVVEALLEQGQDIDHQFEIIVVDDGSLEPVETPLNELVASRGAQVRVRYFFQESRGPAAARNLGIGQAKGDLLLFLGDDILPKPGLLARHVQAHTNAHPDAHDAVLGMADLAPEYRDTPFANWWRRWNFRYQLLLEGKRQPDYSFFYTNNLSVKRAFLIENGLFDEEFRYAAYEDGELGARLSKHGLRVFFEPRAEAEHHHRIDFQSACRRMITRGKAYDMFIEKTSLQGMSSLWLAVGGGPWMAPWLIRPLYRLAVWMEGRVVVSLLYMTVLMYFFQVGRGEKSPIPEVA
jgi:glycosyltransferase involved in cell wall biosynthesis